MLPAQVPGRPSRLLSLAAAAASALLLVLPMSGLAGCWPLLFVALVPLLSVLRRLPPMRAACMGMSCGLLYNIGLLYWIVIVLGRYGGLPPWISVPAMVLLALYMAGYMAVFCLLLGLLLRRSSNGSAGLLLAAPVVWVGLDYLRSILFTGFPWMGLGYGLSGQPLLIQAADLGGQHLITFCVVLVNCLLVLLLERFGNRDAADAGGRLLPVALSCLLLLAVGGYSLLRYPQVAAEMQSGETAGVVAVQGNISQDEKWSAARREDTVVRYLSLTRRGMENRDVDLVVWPETALPFYSQRSPLMGQVLDFVRQEGVALLTGGPYFVVQTQQGAEARAVDYFNSGMLLDSAGRLAGRYDKQHLVPFGEYVPMRPYLPFLEPLVVSIGDFTAGSSSEPLRSGRIRAGVLICFESIFPGIARNEVRAGSNLLLNLTNDAWYGRSSAPYQSLAMTVFRAVENRRSLVRAANTGISGFVDPTGDIRVRSQLFEPAALTETVALLDGQTVFSRGGYWFGAGCMLFMTGLFFFWRRAEGNG